MDGKDTIEAKFGYPPPLATFLKKGMKCSLALALEVRTHATLSQAISVLPCAGYKSKPT